MSVITKLFDKGCLQTCSSPSVSQSSHQQGPLLRDAGSQEEEGVIHEEALELFNSPDNALDSAGSSGLSTHPVWFVQRPQWRSTSDLSRGFLSDTF